MGLTSHNWGYAMSSNDTNQTSNKQDKDGIFIISMSEWEKLFNFAMAQGKDSEAIRIMTAYLVLVRGSGVDNITTSWSSQSIRTYTGISPEPSKRAINLLAEFGFIKIVKEGRKPSYKITLSKKKSKKDDNSDNLFLPNALVTGVSDEVPPIKRLVQYQNPYVLYLFIRLYGFQDKYLDVVNPDFFSSVTSPDDLVATEIYNKNNMVKVWGLNDNPEIYGNFNTEFYDFNQANDADHPLYSKHSKRGTPFIMFNALRELNLIDCVTYACNGDKAKSADEIDYICDINNSEQIKYSSVLRQMSDDDDSFLSEKLDNYSCYVVLPSNYRKVHFQQFYQLHYRTKLGAAPSRHADDAKINDDILKLFHRIIEAI